MKPEDRSSLTVPSRDGTSDHDQLASQHRSAAVGIVREQINSIIQNDPHATATADTHNKSRKGQPAEETKQQTAYPQPSGTIADNSGQSSSTPEPDAVDSPQSPYARTMSQSSSPSTHDSSWQKYHTAWQTYYQQYYERYYVSQVDAARKSLKAQAAQKQSQNQAKKPSSGNNTMS